VSQTEPQASDDTPIDAPAPDAGDTDLPTDDATPANEQDVAAAESVDSEPTAESEPDQDEPTRRGRRHAKKSKRKAPWWELPALVVGAIVLAILLKTFVLQPFFIPSASMEHTLHGCPGCAGDRILVNKTIYDFRDPHGGDIVVFHAPPGWDDHTGTAAPTNPFARAVRGFGQLVGFIPPDGEVLVKRVIATGGQTVRGVEVNGKDEVQISEHGTAGPWKTLNEPYVFQEGSDSKGVFGPVTVPKDRLWVMGDHRDDSLDSRWHCGPSGTSGEASSCDPVSSTVPTKDVIGKAFVIAWPPSRWRTLGTPDTFKNGG
jgi:signal peptidase I